jgi:heptosyltransferase-2
MIAVQYKAKVLLFGGKEEEEYCGDIAQMINASVGSSSAESLAGGISLLESAAAFDACDLVVTNDTGLMHVAAARKRKIVAIFGSTVREFGFFPSSTEHVVVERNGLDCRPCTHIGLSRCPEGHFRCMKEIDVHDVAVAVERLMKIPVH